MTAPLWDAVTLTLASLVVFTSGVITGVTGFGFNLVSAPLLVLLYPPQFVVPVALALGSFASGLLLMQGEIRERVDKRLVRTLFLSALAGLPLGVIIPRRLDSAMLRALIAGLTSLFAVFMLWRYRPRFQRRGLEIVTVGVLSGVLSTSTSLNGPVLSFYLLGCRFTKDGFKSNMIAFIFPTSLSSLMLLALDGSFAEPAARLSLVLIPGLALGLWAGLRLSMRLSQRGFDAAVLWFLAVVGAVSLVNSMR